MTTQSMVAFSEITTLRLRFAAIMNKLSSFLAVYSVNISFLNKTWRSFSTGKSKVYLGNCGNGKMVLFYGSCKMRYMNPTLMIPLKQYSLAYPRITSASSPRVLSVETVWAKCVTFPHHPSAIYLDGNASFSDAVVQQSIERNQLAIRVTNLVYTIFLDVKTFGFQWRRSSAAPRRLSLTQRRSAGIIYSYIVS